MILAKIRFLEQILPIGYKRGVGFNYLKPSWETKNISGIAQKLSLLLNIKNLEIKSFVKPLLQYANIQKEENLRQNWVKASLTLENNQSFFFK